METTTTNKQGIGWSFKKSLEIPVMGLYNVHEAQKLTKKLKNDHLLPNSYILQTNKTKTYNTCNCEQKILVLENTFHLMKTNREKNDNWIKQ